jgi:malonyl-CoA/methylmalonyl-CoA synthetase
VVPAPGASLDAQPVQDALAQRPAKFKLPKRVIFVAELPRNAMGKVQKNVLREKFGDLFARAGNCS